MARDFGQLKAPPKSLGNTLQNLVTSGLNNLGIDERYARHVAGRATGFLNDLTPVGAAIDADKAVSAAKAHRPAAALGNALMAAVGVAPGPGKLAAKGIRKSAGKLEEFMREGNERFVDYIAPDGSRSAMQVIIGPDGMAEISIDPFSKNPNRFGPATLRDGARLLREMYPEIKGLWGVRETGAGPGRTQRADPRKF